MNNTILFVRAENAIKNTPQNLLIVSALSWTASWWFCPVLDSLLSVFALSFIACWVSLLCPGHLVDCLCSVLHILDSMLIFSALSCMYSTGYLVECLCPVLDILLIVSALSCIACWMSLPCPGYLVDCLCPVLKSLLIVSVLSCKTCWLSLPCPG